LSYSFFWLPNCANLFNVILILSILDLCFVMKFQIFLIYFLWWNSDVSNKRFNHADFSYFLDLIYSIQHRKTLYYYWLSYLSSDGIITKIHFSLSYIFGTLNYREYKTNGQRVGCTIIFLRFSYSWNGNIFFAFDSRIELSYCDRPMSRN